MSEYLLLKWGTLKGWDLKSDASKAKTDTPAKPKKAKQPAKPEADE